MTKKLVNKTIFRYYSETVPMKWKDIKNLLLEDEDVIEGHWQGEICEGDFYSPSHYEGAVTRKVLETDEEYEKRLDREKIEADRREKQQYKIYLEFKEKFKDRENG